MAKRIQVGPYKTVFRGKLYKIQHAQATLPNGSKELFERVVRASTVVVLALDSKNRLLLTREYRTSHRKTIWFLPAGRMDRIGESPKDAAQRELREEAGFAAKSLKLMHVERGGNSWVWDTYAFVATGIYESPLPKDEGESIRVVPTPLAKAYRLAITGQIPAQTLTWFIIKLYNERRKWVPAGKRV